MGVRPSRGWATGCAGLALLWTATAAADPDHVLCLAEADPGPTPSCFGVPCGTLHPTLESALEEAAALPDIGGARPEVHLCLGVGSLDDGALWSGNLAIDNRGGTYGEPLVLHLARPMCPASDSPPSQPLIELISDGNVVAAGPTASLSECPSGPRPAVSVWGGGSFVFNAAAVDGWTTYAFANGLGGPAGSLDVREASISGGTGTAVRHGSPVLGRPRALRDGAHRQPHRR